MLAATDGQAASSIVVPEPCPRAIAPRAVARLSPAVVPSEQERAEAERYNLVGHMLALLQANARPALKQRGLAGSGPS